MVDAFMFFLLKLSLIALGFCFLIVCLCVFLVLKWYRKSKEVNRRRVPLECPLTSLKIDMSELLEILLVAFCGLVLVFAILFIGCWCVIACAFYCLKHFYKKTVNLDSMVSAMTLTSTSDAASDDSGSDIESRVYASHGAQGYLESLETGSAAATSIAESHSHYQSLARMETGISRNLQGNESSSIDLRKVKVSCEDIPPKYETLSPPTYASLFPEDEMMIPKIAHVNEKGNPG